MTPPSSTPTLARTRLVKRLNAALARGDVYLSAPAGYGKSTLLGLLLGHRPASELLALTPSDADLSQLQTRLAPRLARSRTIILDDIQHLAGATDGLAWLNEQRRTGKLRWVIGGRTIPPELQDPKREADSLHADDLAFGINEAKALLAGQDPAFVAKWRSRLQGWPLALALLTRGQVADLPNTSATTDLTTHASLFQYLADAIFGSLPDEVLRAAQVSALARRFDDALLASLLGVPLAQATALRMDIQRRALFLEAIEPAGWFKYHDAVRDFLLAQLGKQSREHLIETVIARFEAEGEPHLAIESVLDVGLPERAAHLLNVHKHLILNSFGRFASYERWLARLPEDIHATYPMLTSYFVTELSTVDVPSARLYAWLDRAESLAAGQRDPDVAAEVNRDLAFAYLSQRQTIRALELLWATVRLPITDRPLAARVRSTLGATLAMRFELKAAGQMFDEAQHLVETDQTFAGHTLRFALRHNRANLVDNIVGDFLPAADAIATNIALFQDAPGKLDVCYVGLCTTHEATGDWDALEFDLQENISSRRSGRCSTGQRYTSAAGSSTPQRA